MSEWVRNWVEDDAWSQCGLGGRDRFVLQLAGFVDITGRGAYWIGLGFWHWVLFAYRSISMQWGASVNWRRFAIRLLPYT